MSPISQSNLAWFGASVRGRLHTKQGRPNEDAWMGASGAFGTAITISDGVGSKPYARTGAKMACRAVKDALKPWASAENAPCATLLRLVHLFWGLRVLPNKEEDSAATCLFAVVVPSGKLTIAKLGDGIAAIRNADGSLEIVGDERQGFSNQTTGLGIAKSTKDWAVITKPCLLPDTAVLLATDGIADDLLGDRIGDFIHTLVTEFGSMAPLQRRHALERELRNWATPNHLDDKTLAVLWCSKAEDGMR